VFLSTRNELGETAIDLLMKSWRVLAQHQKRRGRDGTGVLLKEFWETNAEKKARCDLTFSRICSSRDGLRLA
jgi:hypothetical protein